MTKPTGMPKGRKPGLGKVPGSGARLGIEYGPTKLDLPMTAKVVQMARGGMPKIEISKALGLGQNTLTGWLRLGEEDVENGEETVYSQLSLAFDKAEAEFVQSCIALWQTHFREDWRSIQAFMSRRWPKTWGLVTEAMQQGEGVEAIRVALKAEEYEAI